MDDELEKANIALQARMMSKLMRKWTGLIGRKDLYAIFINQLRTDVNARFGDPNVKVLHSLNPVNCWKPTAKARAISSQAA